MKAVLRAVKNQAYEPIEVLVRDATSNEPQGASSTDMETIAKATHNYQEYELLFRMLWKRLTDHTRLLHVHKALILTEYLLRNGSDRFIQDAQARKEDVGKLRRYKFFDQYNNDIGGNVRKKAKAVYELLTDNKKIAEEREKAVHLRRVKDTHTGSASPVASPRDQQPKRERDPYDMYSKTSMELSNEQRKGASKGDGAGKADDNPFDTPADEDPFGEAPAKPAVQAAAEPAGAEQPKKKATKKKAPKAAAQAAQAAGGDDDFGAAVEAASSSKPAAKKPAARAPNPDSFDPVADAFGESVVQAQPQPKASGNIDLLTEQFGGFDPFTGGGGDGSAGGAQRAHQDEDEDGPVAGARVEWGPEKSDDEEEAKEPAKELDPWDLASAMSGGGAGGAAGAGAAGGAGKKDDGKGKKKAVPMNQMKGKSVTMQADFIEGFGAPAAQPQPAQGGLGAFMGGGAAPAGAYGAMPMGGMPMGGVPMGGMPMGGYPMGGAPMGGYPMGGYPMGGYPMGGYPMGGAPMGGAPMGGYPMGGARPQQPQNPNQGNPFF